MAEILHVAAAQIESPTGDVDANLRKHLATIDAARAAGVDLLVFPELSLTGHGSGADAGRVAIDSSHPHVVALAQAAGPMLALFGAVLRQSGRSATASVAGWRAGELHHNAVFSVRNARVVHVHRKINLATYGKLDDGLHFAAGSSVQPFDVDTHWRVAPMICADTWNPPLVHLAAAQQATLMPVAVSSALEAVGGDFDNPSGWDVNLRFHALTYGLPIVMANRVGRENGLTFWGGSRIVDPYGKVIAIAAGGHAEEQLVHATIDHRDVERARSLLPTIRDANHPLLHSEFGRVGRAQR